MNIPFVVFGEDWGAYPSSTQHLVTALLPERKVLWVESIGLRRPRLSDAPRAFRKLAAAAGGRSLRRPPAAGPRPTLVFTPPVIPWPGNALAGAVNRRLLGSAVRRQMARAGIVRPVLWVSLPTAVDAVGALGECAVVYYCGDDFGALDGVDHAPVLEAEARLAARADLILVSHPALAHKFAPDRTHLVPHGVDADKFAGAPIVRSAPADQRVAGFVGTIDNRLDVSALAAAAQALPDWRFEFWGPTRIDIGPLSRLPNLVFPGPMAPDQVPGRIRGWDVALLPYLDTPMVRACSPLKLREYLASGTPIAATQFAAVQEFQDLLEIGTTAGEFAVAVRCAATLGKGRAPQRQARVAGDTWQIRAQQVKWLLATVLASASRTVSS